MGIDLPPPIERLPASFYVGGTLDVARRLLGCILHREVGGEIRRGRIVEVEAYTDDEASHAATGRHTKRNQIMFGPPGTVYVYFTYGMHHCLNVVTEPEGRPGAVLLRGLDGLERAAGPALLCRALGVTRQDNGRDLTRDPQLWIEPGSPVGEEEVVVTRRVGIRKAVDLPWRLYLRGSPGVSRRDRRAEG